MTLSVTNRTNTIIKLRRVTEVTRKTFRHLFNNITLNTNTITIDRPNQILFRSIFMNQSRRTHHSTNQIRSSLNFLQISSLSRRISSITQHSRLTHITLTTRGQGRMFRNVTRPFTIIVNRNISLTRRNTRDLKITMQRVNITRSITRRLKRTLILSRLNRNFQVNIRRILPQSTKNSRSHPTVPLMVLNRRTTLTTRFLNLGIRIIRRLMSRHSNSLFSLTFQIKGLTGGSIPTNISTTLNIDIRRSKSFGKANSKARDP